MLVSGIPNCFSAATTWFIAALFWAMAACAVEARVMTPSCTTAWSGTALTSALPVTVIVRDGGVVAGWGTCAVAGASAAGTSSAISGNQREEGLMRISFLADEEVKRSSSHLVAV